MFVKLSASVRADYMTEVPYSFFPYDQNKLEKPTILMLKSYDEHRVVFDGDASDPSRLQQFLQNSKPVVYPTHNSRAGPPRLGHS